MATNTPPNTATPPGANTQTGNPTPRLTPKEFLVEWQLQAQQQQQTDPAIVEAHEGYVKYHTGHAQTQQQPRQRYVIRDPEFYFQDRPPLAYIVDDLILENSINVWYGKDGTKKTWSLYNLATCVASGKPWLGFDVKPCTVLIIDEESGEHRLADRMKSVMTSENANRYTTPSRSVSMARFDLRNGDEELTLLIDVIEQVGAKLVIIDALVDVMLGGDENAVKDAQPVFANLRYATEVTGASFVIIHHANKAGSLRGSSAIAGALDSLVSVKSEPTSNLINFETEKLRDGKPIKWGAYADWSNGFAMTEADYQESQTITSSQQFALDFFESNPNATHADLVAHAGGLYTDNTMRDAIKRLMAMKLIERTNDTKARTATYGAVIK